MVYKAEVSLYSSDGATWTVERAHYVILEDPRCGTLGRLKMENLEYSEVLKNGDVLIKRDWKKAREKS